VEPQTNDRAYADLVSGLLDARTDPATGRFDAELDGAVTAGEMSVDVARRLRFWQRASLRALTDYTRTVLPTALGALEASRRDAQAYVDELLAALEGEKADEADVGAATPGKAPDAPGSAMTVTLAPQIDLEGPRPRLLVAGLVTTTEHHIRIENR